MSDDLVKRLRQLGDRTGLMFVDYDTTIEAADRIEKLEAALQWITEQERQTAHPTVCAIIKTARKALDAK